MLGRIARHGLTILATVFIGGLLSAALVRFAPGFDADEAELDPQPRSFLFAFRAARRSR
jgi:hypothetical protein